MTEIVLTLNGALQIFAPNIFLTNTEYSQLDDQWYREFNIEMNSQLSDTCKSTATMPITLARDFIKVNVLTLIRTKCKLKREEIDRENSKWNKKIAALDLELQELEGHTRILEDNVVSDIPKNDEGFGQRPKPEYG